MPCLPSNGRGPWFQQFTQSSTIWHYCGVYASFGAKLSSAKEKHPGQTSVPGHRRILYWCFGGPALGCYSSEELQLFPQISYCHAR